MLYFWTSEQVFGSLAKAAFQEGHFTLSPAGNKFKVSGVGLAARESCPGHPTLSLQFPSEG